MEVDTGGSPTAQHRAGRACVCPLLTRCIASARVWPCPPLTCPASTAPIRNHFANPARSECSRRGPLQTPSRHASAGLATYLDICFSPRRCSTNCADIMFQLQHRLAPYGVHEARLWLRAVGAISAFRIRSRRRPACLLSVWDTLAEASLKPCTARKKPFTTLCPHPKGAIQVFVKTCSATRPVRPCSEPCDTTNEHTLPTPPTCSA